jgi:hypothetical protein
MPLTLSTPIEKDGKQYPYCTINLAVSPLVETSTIGGSVSMRLTPYREKSVEEGGGFEFLYEESKAVVYMDIFKEFLTDPAAQVVTQSIMSAIQQFIISKNL